MNSGARSWIPWLAAAGAGSLTAVQSRANGSLGTILDSGLHASVVSFAVGLTVLTLVGLAVRRIRLGMVRLLAALRSGAMPWWWAMGGVFGALFIFSQSFAVGTIGVALFAVAAVAGQNLASLVVDAVGLGPRGRQPVSVVRMASSMIGIVAVGIAVVRRAYGGRAAQHIAHGIGDGCCCARVCTQMAGTSKVGIGLQSRDGDVVVAYLFREGCAKLREKLEREARTLRDASRAMIRAQCESAAREAKRGAKEGKRGAKQAAKASSS